MTSARLLYTHGDPLGTARRFLDIIWNSFNLEKMLISSNSLSNQPPSVRILDTPDQLSEINPFKPLMVTNSTKYIPTFLNENPNHKLGALLRPCEIRALDELEKKQKIVIKNLVTIAFDCLGTYLPEEYQLRAGRRGMNDSLSEVSLQFARQGGIATYRYRSACQMCTAPGAMGADINIQVIGLPARQYLVILTINELTYEKLQLDQLPDNTATSEINRQREWMLAKIVERNGRVRDRIRNALVDILPVDIDSMIIQFNSCGECKNCINVCPIIHAIAPQIDKTGNISQEELIQWTMSCVGCGMCEQACPNHHPLSVIFSYLKELLDEPISNS